MRQRPCTREGATAWAGRAGPHGNLPCSTECDMQRTSCTGTKIPHADSNARTHLPLSMHVFAPISTSLPMTTLRVCREGIEDQGRQPRLGHKALATVVCGARTGSRSGSPRHSAHDLPLHAQCSNSSGYVQQKFLTTGAQLHDSCSDSACLTE